MDTLDIKSWLPEFKVSAEFDTDLHLYFHKTEYLQNIISSDKWLVIGRKGTGKSAIFEYLKKAPQNQINDFSTIALNFKDYPWPIHKLFKESMESELSAYQKSWHYLFIVSVLSKMIEVLKEKKLPLSKELENASKILGKVYGTPFPGLVEIIKSKIFRFRAFSGPSIKSEDLDFELGDLSFEELSDDQKLKSKLKTNAFNLCNFLESLLLSEFKNSQVKFLVLLDQLDESWLHGETEEYGKILINLFNSCKNINYDARYKNYLKIVPFIRTDIFQTLNFNDKNKIYQDNAIEIRWDHDALDDMFFERIQRYKPTEVSLLADRKSTSIFEIKAVRHGASPFKYITRRSFLRPRDIIVYFNKIRETHTKGKSGLYTSKDLYESERNYSNSMFEEIIDEWINQKPEIKEILSILQSIGYQTFNMKTFEEKFSKLENKISNSPVREILRFLFQNSIIGQKIYNHWEYFCVNQNLQIDFDKDFNVNPALKKRLSLTEGYA